MNRWLLRVVTLNQMADQKTPQGRPACGPSRGDQAGPPGVPAGQTHADGALGRNQDATGPARHSSYGIADPRGPNAAVTVQPPAVGAGGEGSGVTEMEFCLLGPLLVRSGGVEVAVPRGKQRTVLAALLLNADRVVSMDKLIDTLWGDEPPARARVDLQNLVKLLRQALGEPGRSRIITREPGYVIRVEAGELDVTRFEDCLRAAQAAAAEGSWDAAASQARAALALWRDEPLADAGSEELAAQQGTRLAEMRLQALVARLDADLHLGRHAELIAELRYLTGAHPLEERLHSLLILALHRDGRQAEALVAYEDARRMLVEKNGIGPGPALRDLHQRIITVNVVPDKVRLPRPRPAESPYRGLSGFGEDDAALFFGRNTAAAQVLALMSRSLKGAGLVVVSGASGAGKSSLVRAGVLPRLREKGLEAAPEAAAWQCVVLAPGPKPLEELAVRVARAAGADAAAVSGSLAADPVSFALTARQAALAARVRAGATADEPGQQRVLIIVDQAEQLFTQCPAGQQRQAFLAALHAAATIGHGQSNLPAALVVLVIRADFEARLADYPELAEAVQHRYLLTAMTRQQLEAAITEPAKAAGSRVDDDLVKAVLEEAGLKEAGPKEPGAGAGLGKTCGAGVLPLLSHALDQAWQGRTGPTLTRTDYERAGGIEEAVAASAQGVYDHLTKAQQEIAQQVFTWLTATSDDGVVTAARRTRAYLTEGHDAAEIEAVLEAFAAKRLLTLAADGVEISHEAVLTAWPLLRDTWLAESKDDRIILTRLQKVAAEWLASGDRSDSSSARSYLYRGSLLRVATETAARILADPARRAELTRTDLRFLDASNRAHRRATRWRRGLTAGLVALTLPPPPRGSPCTPPESPRSSMPSPCPASSPPTAWPSTPPPP